MFQLEALSALVAGELRLYGAVGANLMIPQPDHTFVPLVAEGTFQICVAPVAFHVLLEGLFRKVVIVTYFAAERLFVVPSDVPAHLDLILETLLTIWTDVFHILQYQIYFLLLRFQYCFLFYRFFYFAFPLFVLHTFHRLLLFRFFLPIFPVFCFPTFLLWFGSLISRQRFRFLLWQIQLAFNWHYHFLNLVRH